MTTSTMKPTGATDLRPLVHHRRDDERLMRVALGDPLAQEGERAAGTAR